MRLLVHISLSVVLLEPPRHWKYNTHNVEIGNFSVFNCLNKLYNVVKVIRSEPSENINRIRLDRILISENQEPSPNNEMLKWLLKFTWKFQII